MPRVAQEREIVKDLGNGMAEFKSTFKDQGVEKEVTFEAPKDAVSFKNFVNSLSNDPVIVNGKTYASDLAGAYYEYMYAVEQHNKQREREQAAQESTIIVRDGRKIDLMEIPLPKALLVVNSGFSMASATESAPPSAVASTRKKLIAAGKVKESGEAVTWNYKDSNGELVSEKFAQLVAA